jgi:hypothetical protein
MPSIPEGPARRQPAAVGQVVISSPAGTWIAVTNQPVATVLEAVRAGMMPLPSGATLPVLVSEISPVPLAVLTDAELLAVVPFLNKGFVPLDVLRSAGAVVLTIPLELHQVVDGRGARRARRRRRRERGA